MKLNHQVTIGTDDEGQPVKVNLASGAHLHVTRGLFDGHDGTDLLRLIAAASVRSGAQTTVLTEGNGPFDFLRGTDATLAETWQEELSALEYLQELVELQHDGEDGHEGENRPLNVLIMESTGSVMSSDSSRYLLRDIATKASGVDIMIVTHDESIPELEATVIKVGDPRESPRPHARIGSLHFVVEELSDEELDTAVKE